MAATRVFFSHATEDKGRVLAVYERLVARYPDLEPWVDTFEITGGQALLDRIAAGMDEAERFFVFLSPVSIEKPWVQAEFRRALTQELSGQRPEYVVPVKMGGLTRVPAFMENKKYINLDTLTEAEWLGEFYAAASGAGLSKEFAVEPNLIIDGATFPSEPHVAQFRIQVRHWAEEASFKAITREPAASVKGWFEAGGRPGGGGIAELLTDSEAGYSEKMQRLTPGAIFVLDVRFPQGVSAAENISEIVPWDGQGATFQAMQIPQNP